MQASCHPSVVVERAVAQTSGSIGHLADRVRAPVSEGGAKADPLDRFFAGTPSTSRGSGIPATSRMVVDDGHSGVMELRTQPATVLDPFGP